jgi:pimeloyl-ACP methyl ester carboxylesterase|tara:strand:- start:229 stop:1092 length:864 start_codon:yes stop_codon:yes gene_type:complete
MSDAKTIAFQSSEGFPIAADAYGDPSHDPVLFMHGGGQTRHAWGGAAAALAKHGWYTISMDHRGHGDSGWSEDANYELDYFVEDFHTVQEQIGRRMVVCGASLGGRTALLGLGGGNQDLTSALILVDIAPKTEPKGVARIQQFMRANLDGFPDLEAAADAVAAYREHRSRPKDISGLKKNLRLKADGRWYWHWDPKYIDRRDREDPSRVERVREVTPNIKVPTLLIRGGSSDVVSPEGVKDFLELLPTAQFIDVADAGHMVAGDKNDIFTDAVMEFLGRTFTEHAAD